MLQLRNCILPSFDKDISLNRITLNRNPSCAPLYASVCIYTRSGERDEVTQRAIGGNYEKGYNLVLELRHPLIKVFP